MSEVKAAKRLGQHFLVDEQVVARLVETIRPKQGESVIEIGPGLGALTLPLLAACGEMAAVEFDERVLEPLARDAGSLGKLHLLHADVLQVHFAEMGLSKPLRIVGNLPYNLSSPIIFHCVAQRNDIKDMVFMLQKEVVDRICALPGSKTYGRLSIMVQLYCETEAVFEISPSAFDPPPKVRSAVVRLTPRPQPAWDIADIETFDQLVRTAFSQRRKMIRKSLGAWFDSDAFRTLGIDETMRPEMLSGVEFAKLANHLTHQNT